MFLFAFPTAILPFVSSDKVSYCIEFFYRSACLQEVFFCKTNFITDLTLLLHQLQELEIVSGNEIALRKTKNKEKKRLFHFIFPLLPDNCCYRCWRNSINEILLEKQQFCFCSGSSQKLLSPT
jgi:hypothetical protein